jgi:hypothetical protein
MVVSRAIRQAKYKLLQVLTKQEEGDAATSKDQRLPKLQKAITKHRSKHVEKYVELSKGFNMVARSSKKPNSDAS